MEYRCVNAACGKAFPRQVAFCPYCGTSQAADAVRPAVAAAVSRPVSPAAPPPPVTPPPSPAAPGATFVLTVPPAAPPAAAPQPAPQPPPRPAQPRPAAAPAATAPDGPAAPPLRKPVGIGTWILIVLFLLGVWYLVKPGAPSRQLEKRVDAAVALTQTCRLTDARAELAELRDAKAGSRELERLEHAIEASATACERKQSRTKAWADTRKALEVALGAGALDKAAGRLSAFTHKYSEDDDTREWRDRIDAKRAEKLLDEANACLARKDRVCVQNKLDAAARLKRDEAKPRIDALRESLSRLLESTLLEQAPAALAPRAPVSQPARTLATADYSEPDAREARRLQQEAERDIAGSNYRSAMGKAAQCVRLSSGGGECVALRERATQLDHDYQRCLAGGNKWVDGRCQ